MAPSYKLYYFNFTGRAEPIRYIFAYAGQDYEDKRLKREEWSELKPNTPWGKMPMLEVDGKKVSQSTAIGRYLGKQFGLLGKNDWENVKADELLDTLNDFSATSFRLFGEKDPEKIENIKKDQAAYLEKFEKIASKSSESLVAAQLTWADLFFAASLSSVQERHPDLLAPYTNLVAFIEKINNLPQIKAWIARRPKNDPMPGPPGKK